MDWRINQWRLVHPVHDTFFITVNHAGDSFRASRVFKDATQKDGLGHEFITAPAEGEFPAGHASLEKAQAAVAKRIAELDAEAAQPTEVAS